MSERKINLNRIINNHIDTSKMNKYDKQAIVNGFIMFGEQLLKLAAENAKSHYIICGANYKDNTNVDKQSILDTIKQVE